MPEELKGGVLHPLLKMKCKNNPNNYRGITITSLIGKVIDYIHLQHQTAIIENKHKLNSVLQKVDLVQELHS